MQDMLEIEDAVSH